MGCGGNEGIQTCYGTLDLIFQSLKGELELVFDGLCLGLTILRDGDDALLGFDEVSFKQCFEVSKLLCMA